MSQYHLVEVQNPFQPTDRAISTREWDKPVKLNDAFPELVLGPLVISINGRVIEDADRANTYIQANDYVVTCPIPQGGGGGGGKGIFRIVALIAVSMFAPYLGAALHGALWGAGIQLGMAGLTVLQAGVMVAGGLLVNALMPPPKPPTPEAGDTSPTYGIDGPKNTSAEGVPVPVVYGKFRYGGNVINNYTVNDGDAQWLYMLLAISEGPISDIRDILLNDVPIIEYKDYWVEKTRLGLPLQEPIEWFADTIVPHSIAHELTTSFHTYTTSGEVDRLRFDFNCPAGIFNMNFEGKIGAFTIPVAIEYRVNGTGTWFPLKGSGDVATYNEVTTWLQIAIIDPVDGFVTYGTYTPTGSETRVGDAWYASVWNGTTYVQQQVGIISRQPLSVNGGVFNIKGKQRTAYRQSIMSEPLPEAVYDVRVKRVNPKITDPEQLAHGLAEDIYWSDINEITNEDVAYRNTAVLGLKIRMSDQLNGLPNVTSLVEGKWVAVYNEVTNVWDFKWTDNPAWIALDILTNKRYGMGRSFSRFDMYRWREWARYCDLNGLKFNAVFDTTSNPWDAAQEVFRCGHAQMIRSGTRYSVAIEAPSSPVQMFSVGNMIQGTFQETWLPLNERSNEIEATYADEADNYKMHTIRVYDRNAATLGLPQRTSQVTLKGVTNMTQAWNDAWVMLNMNRYLKQSVEFSAPIEAINCTIGDVILVQHDMPKWGDGGRLETGSTTTVVNLDRSVTFEPSKSYSLFLRRDAMQRYSGTIASVTNIGTEQTRLVLNSYDEVNPISRLKIGANEYPVKSTFSTTGGDHGVIIDYVAGLSGGTAYQLWATDVIETRTVVNPAIGSNVVATSVTVSVPFAVAPPHLSVFMFGELTKVAKPFRVRSISGSHEYKRDIKAIEYNATVYNPVGGMPTPNYSGLDREVEHVTIDGVEENLVVNGNSTKSVVTVHYSSTQQIYRQARVYASIDGGPFNLVGTDFQSVTIDAGNASTVQFKVIAQDAVGGLAPDSTAPISSVYTVEGKTRPPRDITGLTATAEEFGIRLNWTPATDFDLREYEIRQGGTNWDTATFVERIKATTYLMRVRTAGSYTLRVKAIDAFGNYSTNAANVTSTITAPTVSGLAYRLNGANEVLEWAPVPAGFSIDHFQIRHGASWGAGTVVGTTKATIYERKVDYAGSRNYMVAAVDAAGNVGAHSTVSAVITIPGAPTSARSEVVDNNALLFWQPPVTGSLPIERYEVRRGASWAGGVVVGSNGNSTFTTYFEQQSGTYTYWIASYDTAGNLGAQVSITATINQPPDYVLRTSVDSTFSGTKTNMAVDGGTLVGPFDTAETWGTHFSSRGWTSPQSQITAGYPIYLQPSVTSGSYDESFDYGSTLAATTVTATLNSTVITGSVTVSCQIYTKLLAGDPWTAAAAGATSVLVSNFRYVRVVWTFTCTAGANLIRVNAFNLKLANKLKTDSGTFTITNATAGVVVPFGVTFVDADTPVCQANGATALIPIVDFVDAPNPTGFTVYLHNPATGVKVTGSGSWTARGF